MQVGLKWMMAAQLSTVQIDRCDSETQDCPQMASSSPCSNLKSKTNSSRSNLCSLPLTIYNSLRLLTRISGISKLKKIACLSTARTHPRETLWRVKHLNWLKDKSLTKESLCRWHRASSHIWVSQVIQWHLTSRYDFRISLKGVAASLKVALWSWFHPNWLESRSWQMLWLTSSSFLLSMPMAVRLVQSLDASPKLGINTKDISLRIQAHRPSHSLS